MWALGMSLDLTQDNKTNIRASAKGRLQCIWRDNVGLTKEERHDNLGHRRRNAMTKKRGSRQHDNAGLRRVKIGAGNQRRSTTHERNIGRGFSCRRRDVWSATSADYLDVRTEGCDEVWDLPSLGTTAGQWQISRQWQVEHFIARNN